MFVSHSMFVGLQSGDELYRRRGSSRESTARVYDRVSHGSIAIANVPHRHGHRLVERTVFDHLRRPARELEHLQPRQPLDQPPPFLAGSVGVGRDAQSALGPAPRARVCASSRFPNLAALWLSRTLPRLYYPAMSVARRSRARFQRLIARTLSLARGIVTGITWTVRTVRRYTGSPIGCHDPGIVSADCPLLGAGQARVGPLLMAGRQPGEYAASGQCLLKHTSLFTLSRPPKDHCLGIVSCHPPWTPCGICWTWCCRGSGWSSRIRNRERPTRRSSGGRGTPSTGLWTSCGPPYWSRISQAVVARETAPNRRRTL